MKIVDIFKSEIRIPNVCKSNLNSNFKTEVRKFELCLTSLIACIGQAEQTGMTWMKRQITLICADVVATCYNEL